MRYPARLATIKGIVIFTIDMGSVNLSLMRARPNDNAFSMALGRRKIGVIPTAKPIPIRGMNQKNIKNRCHAIRIGIPGTHQLWIPDFIGSIHELITKIKPDIVLAEPVGSCTDLLATVYAPLRRYYGGKISLAPYTVLVDASTILEFN